MFETDRVYIVELETCYEGDFFRSPLVVFPDEKSTIAFLNSHTPTDFAVDQADFIVSILPFGDPYGVYDPSPELESAVDAANDR